MTELTGTFTKIALTAKGVVWEHEDARVIVTLPEGWKDGSLDHWTFSWTIGEDVMGRIAYGTTSTQAYEEAQVHWLLEDMAKQALQIAAQWDDTGLEPDLPFWVNTSKAAS